MSLLLKKLSLLIFLLPVLHQPAVFAQARFTATISPSSIGKNETAELRLMVENARQVEQIIPPSLKDFVIISGPNQESGMENNNGVTKQYIGITYQLQPKAKGNFTIGAASAAVDGKNITSNKVTIQVTNAAAGGQNNNSSPFSGFSFFDQPVRQQTTSRDFILKKGENVPAKIDKNIFIKVDADKKSCYIGEPVVVTYKLFTRLKSESNIIKNPSFNGFSVIDLSQPGSSFYNIEKLNGREYNVYTLRKAQLYPLQAGAMELETSEVENNIHFVKEEFLKTHPAEANDILNDQGISGLPAEAMQDEKVTLQSRPVLITVKALPEAGTPLSFKGAVGNFTLDAGIEKNNFSTDDAGKLLVLISGQGNMNLINAPEIKWPQGIESYEPIVKEALNKQDVPVSGSKRFEYPFTVTTAGTYTLPPVEYSYFDATAGTYKTLTTKPIIVSVTKGTGKPAIAKNTTPAKSDKEHFFDTIFTNRFWIIIPVALIIFTGLFFWIKNENRKETAAAIVSKEKENSVAAPVENEIQQNPLAAAEERLVQQDSQGFYKALNKELRDFLADRLAVPVETINKKRIAEELDKKGVAVNTSLQVQQLLSDVEWQLYTPFADENKMQEMYQAANNIVHSFTPIP
jgi:hypothetical protein